MWKGKGILVAEQRRRRVDELKHEVRGRSLSVFSCSPASQTTKGRAIAPPALSAAFCFCLRDGAMGKLHVRKEQGHGTGWNKEWGEGLAPELSFATFG